MSNPYLPQENYEVQDSSVREEETIGYIAWHTFMTNENGKKLLEFMRGLALGQPAQGPIDESYPLRCVYNEGFRDAFRQMVAAVQGYQQKKDEEAKLAMGA